MPRNTIEIIDPENGKTLRSYTPHGPEKVDEILRLAQSTHKTWRRSSIPQRTQMLATLSKVLLREKLRLAELMKEEMGKSIKDGEAEVEKCAACAQYYIEKGPGFLATQSVSPESFVAFQPLGTVLAIMPWNFPLWQVFRCAIPATLAGNSVVLKHASNVSGCALAIEKIWQEASNEASLLQTILLPGSEVLALIARPEIQAVSFTGSTEVGRKIGAAAGAHLKKSVLELGGSDAYVVLADANLDKAAEICAKSRLINSGQSCISAKRFIVEKKVQAEFTEKFLQHLTKHEIAPMARENLRQDLQSQVDRSIAMGAKLLCGGKIPVGPGFHYPPTLLTNVKPGMPAFDEELFGPVAALIVAEDEAMALQLANQTNFGLGAAIFTKNIAKGRKLAEEELEAGSCFVNDFVRSDPALPFGGIKESGFGRELAEFGIREFVNVKTIKT